MSIEEETRAGGSTTSGKTKNPGTRTRPLPRRNQSVPPPVCEEEYDDKWALMGKRQQRPKPSVQDTMGVNTQVFETPVSYRYRCMEDRFGTDSTDLIQISEDVSITRRWWEKEACR